MAALMAAKDWSQTPLGPVSRWPQSLRTVVRILLTSRYAMWMGWGPELSFFYNDAYRPTLGLKDSWALGSPARKVWEEIWPDIGPRVEHVLANGEATWDEGLQLFLKRRGYAEETYHTFSYSPLSDESGRVSGMLCVVTEETNRVIGERRLGVLRDLAIELSSANTESEVLSASRRTLTRASRDFPFGLIYLYDERGQTLHLASHSGADSASPIAPRQLDINDLSSPWPIAKLGKSNEPLLTDGLTSRFTDVPRGPWPEPPTDAILVPLLGGGQEKPVGVLIAGQNPYRPFDEAYRSFVGLFAGQLTAGLNSAHAYEAERRRVESLAEIDRAKTIFFSNVSHEFRTPLTLMLGPLTDTLAQQNGPVSERVAEELRVVHRNALRLLKLVNTLLDFSRIEAGRVQASFVPTDLSAFTADLASVFRSATEKAGLYLKIDAPPLSAEAYVDRDMWEKIVLNLISNAFKYTLNGGITVRLRGDDEHIKLSVQDTGSGIPESELPRLFERFHRVEGTRGRTHEGTGIGLALVQELVKIHGGTIQAESKVEEGTTFTITIPAGKEHLAPERIQAPRTLESTAVGFNAYVEEAMRWLPSGSAEKQTIADSAALETAPLLSSDSRASGSVTKDTILVADDNADMRDYVTRLLSDRYQVTAVSDGREALAAARKNHPALILSDVMMPNLDGLGLLRAVRADSDLAGTPVLLLSARAGEEATLDGIRAGADDYIVKPFSARELIARIDAQIARKRFEKQIANVEQRLHSALAAAKMAAWEWDSVNDICNASDTANDVYGLRADQRFTDSIVGFGLVHPDDREKHSNFVRGKAERGEDYHTEFRIIRPRDGRLAWLEERAHSVTDSATGFSRMVGLVTDITERKNAEIMLRRNEERAQFIVKMDDALRGLNDPDEMSNAAARVLCEHIQCDRALYVEVDEDEDNCTVTGEYSPGRPSIKGQYRISQYGKDYVDTVRADRPYIENDTTRSSLSPIEREQFANLQIGSFVSAPLFKRGKLVAMFVVHDEDPRQWQESEIEDVNLVASRIWESIERARVSRALETSEERLGLAVEAGELGTFHCPLPLGVIIWNRKCKEHFWLPADAEVNIERFYSLLHEQDRDRTRQAVEHAVFQRQPYDVEYRTVSPEGTVRWIRAKGRAYYDSDGQPTRFDGITLDITELKVAETRREELLAAERQARAEAERVSRMKDEFLATLSHELRTPLNAILGWSQILNHSQVDSEDAKQGLEAIERNARAQTQMIEDLLDMSRIISGKVRLDVQRLALAEVVTNAVQSVRPSAEVKGVRLITVLDPHAGPIAGDAGRLQQVFWNLLTNAIKFTPRGGRVQVVLERVNSHLEVSVIDTGEGIDPSFLPYVFERFRQADASTTRRFGGLGLGLSIVKNIVELHGGSVRVKSAGKGQGATFTVALPIASTIHDNDEDLTTHRHPRISQHAPSFGESPDLQGITILVVDDDADARDVMRRILGDGAGAKIILAASAAEAMELLQRQRPNILISDIGMPEEDGYDLIRKVRALPPESGGRTPAIALTAFARSEDRQRALRTGYQMHVAKPVEPSELLTVCASLTGRV
jgi:PAS domain S-box-containing protein